MSIWFTLIVIIYSSLNWLIARQLYDLIRINHIVFWLVFIVIAYSPILGRFGVRALEPVGNYWMVFFYYGAFVSVLAIFINNKPFIMVSYLIIVLVITYGYINANNIKVQNYNVAISKNSDNLHVVMLSDIHIDKAKKNDYVEKMVANINKLNPDLVLLIGDIFDDRDISVLERQKSMLKSIKTKYGVYGVLGNHEYYTGNINEVLKIFKESNIKILRDEIIEIEGIYLVGREDASKARKNLNDLLKGINKEKPVIMLDHQPVKLEEAEKNGVDLQLSGHTHRGQFFPNQFITKKMYENDYGYLVKGRLQVIVSSGYGTWGPPVRIGSQSEIVDLNIIFTK